MSEHFSVEELCRSDIAIRLGMDNTPPAGASLRLDLLMAGLEEVRALLDNPMNISSGYRCQNLNTYIGGAAGSDHILGYAADFTCPGYGSPLEIVRKIQQSPIDFGQVIQEGRWVHISFNPKKDREVLTAHFSPTGVTYTSGA
jgi:uncharacterized protein YcbK (DUF882 family)